MRDRPYQTTLPRIIMSKALVFIDDTPALSPLEMRAKARSLKKKSVIAV